MFVLNERGEEIGLKRGGGLSGIQLLKISKNCWVSKGDLKININ